MWKKKKKKKANLTKSVYMYMKGNLCIVDYPHIIFVVQWIRYLQPTNFHFKVKHHSTE